MRLWTVHSNIKNYFLEIPKFLSPNTVQKTLSSTQVPIN